MIGAGITDSSCDAREGRRHAQVATDALNLTGPVSRARVPLGTASALLPQRDETVMRDWFSHSITLAAITAAGNAVASLESGMCN
jgi:hypothetical protein